MQNAHFRQKCDHIRIFTAIRHKRIFNSIAKLTDKNPIQSNIYTAKGNDCTILNHSFPNFYDFSTWYTFQCQRVHPKFH